MGAAGLLACSQAQAQTAQQIIDRVTAAYKNAKTYQANMAINTNAGPQGSMTMNMDIKSQQNQKYAIRMSATGTGQAAQMAGMLNMQMVDNGKTAYTYMPMMGGYTKKPHVANAGALNGMPSSPAAFFKGGGNYKLLAPTRVNGVPVYTVQMSNPRGGTATLYVDKATYHLKQIKAMGQNGQPVTVNVTNERLNAPLPANAFVFTPPPGAKEVKGGGPGMMGGGMGR